MKYVLSALVLTLSSTGFAQGYSCLKYAEAVAVNAMNKSLADEKKPEKLEDYEKAQISQTDFLDQNGEITNKETGIYGVTMGVMEECLDGYKVETKVTIKNGKPSCTLIKLSSLGQRDCG